LFKLLVVQVVGCLRCWLSELLVVEFMHTKLRAYALELMLIKVEGLFPGVYAQLKLRAYALELMLIKVEGLCLGAYAQLKLRAYVLELMLN